MGIMITKYIAVAQSHEYNFLYDHAMQKRPNKNQQKYCDPNILFNLLVKRFANHKDCGSLYTLLKKRMQNG